MFALRREFHYLGPAFCLKLKVHNIITPQALFASLNTSHYFKFDFKSGAYIFKGLLLLEILQKQKDCTIHLDTQRFFSVLFFSVEIKK